MPNESHGRRRVASQGLPLTTTDVSSPSTSQLRFAGSSTIPSPPAQDIVVRGPRKREVRKEYFPNVTST